MTAIQLDRTKQKRRAVDAFDIDAVVAANAKHGSLPVPTVPNPADYLIEFDMTVRVNSGAGADVKVLYPNDANEIDVVYLVNGMATAESAVNDLPGHVYQDLLDRSVGEAEVQEAWDAAARREEVGK